MDEFIFLKIFENAKFNIENIFKKPFNGKLIWSMMKYGSIGVNYWRLINSSVQESLEHFQRLYGLVGRHHVARALHCQVRNSFEVFNESRDLILALLIHDHPGSFRFLQWSTQF